MLRLLAFVVIATACAPAIDGPVERQHAVDRADSDRLSADLAALPGVTSAHATLHRATRDPLTAATTPASATAMMVIDGDPAPVTSAADRLLRAAAPEVATPALVVQTGARRAELANVGPFTVDARSRRPLAVALGLGLLAIAGLAGALAWTARPRGAA